MPRPRQQQSSERQGLDLAVSGLDQAVAVLDAEIGTLETQLKNKRDERRELQQTRVRLTKLGGNSSTAASPRAGTGRRARTGTTRSASAASTGPAAAATPRRTRRRSPGRAPAAEREAAIIQAITSKPMTAVETAKAVGLSQPRARQILKKLRDSGRLRVEEVSRDEPFEPARYTSRGRPRRLGAGTGESAAAATAASLSLRVRGQTQEHDPATPRIIAVKTKFTSREVLICRRNAGFETPQGEPAGQLAARELEIQRISSALRRAEELSVDAAAALEGAA